MGLFQKLFKIKNPDSPRYRWKKAREICNHHIRYVTEKTVDPARDTGTCAYEAAEDATSDAVIGRDGALNIEGEDLLVFASGTVLFRCPVAQLQAWTLLSGDGVVLTGPDKESDGKIRTITVYYFYYR